MVNLNIDAVSPSLTHPPTSPPRETFIKFDHRKDAIVQTHQINPFDFLPHISATPDGITISVEDKRSLPLDRERPLFQQVLGYIRFNKVQGSAEFTNFGSNLDYRCLELGHTTKKKDHRLAGGHGEGLKIAALVLCRENHHVKISANSFHWHFGFNGLSKANFFCRLIPAKVKREPSAPSDTGRPAKLSAKIGEDVSVTIEKGQKGRPLSTQDFGAWMRDTIDLHPSSGRIRTPSGDLLLEPMYQGHMYLKGMRVPEPSLDGQAFRFGYNLTQGGVDRDRQRLVDPRQVTENIHKIWESAIAQTEGVALPRYLELFRHHPLSADARGADRLVAETTARRMWDALNYESKMGDLFYYSESHQNEVPFSLASFFYFIFSTTYGSPFWFHCVTFLANPCYCLLGFFHNPGRVEEGAQAFAGSAVGSSPKVSLGPRADAGAAEPL